MNTRFFTLATVAFPLVFALACVEDVGSGKVAAELAEPAPVAAQVEGRQLAIDTSRSEVRALGAKITAKHPIVFDEWSGQLRAEGTELLGVDVTIQMNSLRADVDKLTEHLKTEDFFHVERFPTATFISTSVAAQLGPDGVTHKVTGDLTLHGVTRHVGFPVKVKSNGQFLDATAEFVIDRQDFGIAYPGMPDDLIQDNVVLTIQLSGKHGQS